MAMVASLEKMMPHPPTTSAKNIIDRDPGGQSIWTRRVIPWCIFLGCLGLLVRASLLSPSAEGLGTHTQMGMPTCQFLTTFDTPCVSCGMTTSFALVTNGRFVEGFLNQPAGFVLAIFAAMMVWVSGYAIYRGVGIGCYLGGAGRSLTWALAIVLAIGWIYKIMKHHHVLGGFLG